jgi:ribosomal protein L17
VGRLVVILFSLGSLFLIYFIAKKLVDSKFAVIASLVYSFIPASTIFGKMIGQEPLALFFCLSTIFGILKYSEHKSGKYVALAIVSVFFGTLCDWPMTYFSLLIFAYLFHHKEKKLAVAILLTSLITALCYLIYVNFMLSGLSEIAWAITVRSVGTLLSQPYWGLRWISIITLRFVLYFNPVFVGLGFYFFIKSIFMHPKSSKEKELFFILLVLFGFGLIHVLLYPDGSFGHPYWIYYFIPFVVFSSAIIISKLLEARKIILFLTLLFSLIFMFMMQHWKFEQTKANLWRYSLAQKLEVSLVRDEKIETNLNSAVDRELFRYVFSHEVKLVDKLTQIDQKNYSHFVYSCSVKCNLSEKVIHFLLENYESRHFSNNGGEAYVFSLKSKNKNNLEIGKLIVSRDNNIQETKSNSFFKNIYRLLVNFLDVPQI